MAMLMAVTAAGSVTLAAETTQVQAENTTTVTGTVASDTTDSTLYLNTSGGTMTIKIDSDTVISGSKLFLVGKQLTVTFARGSDAYNHARTITSEDKTKSVSIDGNSSVSVSGTVSSDTTDTTLYLITSDGTMTIRMDGNTDFSGTSAIYAGKTVTVTVARGSDAYMHATKIVSGSTVTNGTTSSQLSGTMIQGTVGENSNNEVLYLVTSGGTMTIKIDSDTDFSYCHLLKKDLTVGVDYYRGSDAYLHAKKVVGNYESTSSVSLESNTSTVVGTVTSDSTENVLALSTSGGTMKIKLDSGVTAGSYYKVLYPGQYVQVTVARGSDAYMHAVSFLGSTATAGGTSITSATGAVQGTIAGNTTSSMLYLATSAGTMIFKIDSNTYKDTAKDLTAGTNAVVAFYRGNDAYNHASIIITY